MYRYKSLLLLALPLITVHTIAFGRGQKEPIVRVLISYRQEVSLRADKEIPLVVRGIDSRKKSLSSLKIKIENGRVRVTENNKIGNTFSVPTNKKIQISSRDTRGIWFNNKRRYRGLLIIDIVGNNLRVINHLPVENYLKSVVGSEMPKTFSLEALKAQAVAARTYCLNQLKKKKYYDLNASESDQAYLGIEAETPRIIQAVNSTRSLVILYKGRLIDAVFHSSSGGKTEDSKWVWKERSYLKSVRDFDQASPNFNWRKSFNSEQLKIIFPETGGVNKIDVLSRSTSGRVLKTKLYGPIGHIIISGKSFRKRMGLKSTLFDFKMSRINEQKSTSNNYILTDNISINLLSSIEDPINHFLKTNPPPLPLIPSNNFLIIQGSGAGHGVGMSQWGANALAERGSKFKSILKYYYKGVNIGPYNASVH